MTETSATRTETNREVIRQAFDAWRQGTGAITDVFAPGMVWRIEGHSAASKEYRSKQQFIDEVLAPFGARFTVSEPFRPVTIRAVYADDDTVIVIWDGRGIASGGQPYENSYAWIMKLADGKVIDGTAFYDSISFNDLWARVQPRRAEAAAVLVPVGAGTKSRVPPAQNWSLGAPDYGYEVINSPGAEHRSARSRSGMCGRSDVA
jgi:ketosteroid isomerase-like protein